MKKLINPITFLIFCLIIPSLCFSFTKEGTIYTTDGSRADVLSAITDSTTGDTVTLPGGGFTWTSGVSIPDAKKITLQGAGYDNTLITTSGTAIWMNLSGSRITGIGFILTAFSDSIINVKGTGWRIDNCKFNNTTGLSVVSLYINGTNVSQYPTGLVDNCVFINGRIVVDGLATFAKMSALWLNPINLGTEDAAYVEDCNFSRNDGGQRNAIDGNEAGMYVFRYNTITDSYVELHGLQSSAIRAPRKFETYRNTLHSSNNQYLPLRYRSGTGVLFGNELSGNYNSRVINFYLDRYFTSVGVAGKCDGTSTWDGNTAIDSGTATSGSSTTLVDSGKSWANNQWNGYQVWNVTEGGILCRGLISATGSDNITFAALSPSCSGDGAFASGETYKIASGWPCRDQQGRGPDEYLFVIATPPYPSQESVPIYLWQNRDKGVDGQSNNIANVYISGGLKLIQANRDYYTEVVSFDGTLGTGYGLLANRPASCTTGVAYWATDQGTWNKKPAGLQGVLYKCTATDTWTSYYTPYQYPHPLRNEEADITAPVMSALSPTAQQPCTPGPTANVTIGLTTTDATNPVTCKFDLSDTTYALMGTTFSTTGGNSHSHGLTGLACDASHTYYVRCQDAVTPTPNTNTVSGQIVFSVAPASDTTPPTLSSAVLGTDGRTLTITFNESVKFGAGGNSGFIITPSGGAATVSYFSGNYSTALVYITSRIILSTETLTLSYTQPGNGVEDNAGNDKTTFNDQVVTNNSTQTPTPAIGATLWSSDVTVGSPYTPPSGQPVNIGVRFGSTVAGVITGIRFYKQEYDTGTHVGNIWTSYGLLKGSVTFTGETASGWQQMSFATPIHINANTLYVASYFCPTENHTVTYAYFASSGVNNAPLYSPQTTEGIGYNGVYLEAGTNKFPVSGSPSGRNFWVDIVFEQRSTVNTTGGSHSISLTGGSHSITW